ncbi:MAG: hypothetical protein ABIW46_06260 [Acidimicrobiales bacterium]
MTRLFFVGAALVAALAIAGAGCADTGPTGDGPTGQVDDSPAEVINFPNKFANVAHKCDGYGHRVYSTTRPAPPVVVDDPTCGANGVDPSAGR